MNKLTRRMGAATFASVTLIGAVGLFAGGGINSPAVAKIEPPPVTLPPLPAPVTQTLGLGAPVLDNECGSLITVLTLVVPDLGGSLPIDLTPLFAGIIDFCGSVPQPSTHLQCGVDTTITNAIAKELGADKIFLALVNTAIAAPVAEEIATVGMPLPASLATEDLISMVDKALECVAVTGAGSGTSKPVTLGSGPPAGLAVPPSPTSPSSSSPSESSPLPPASSSAPEQVASGVAPATSGQTPQPPASLQPDLVAVTTPSGGTPVGSAVVGLLLILAIAGVIAVGLHRQATPRGPSGPPGA